MSSASATSPETAAVTVYSRAATTLHPSTPSSSAINLPGLLHTPLGMALIEIQGTINHPSLTETVNDNGKSASSLTIGRLVFPDLTSNGVSGIAEAGVSEGPWMKRAWLYVGEHQRLTGEVKKLPKPLGVLRRRKRNVGAGEGGEGMDVDADGGIQVNGADAGDGGQDELEIADVIRWKVIFSSRPEPVGVV